MILISTTGFSSDVEDQRCEEHEENDTIALKRISFPSGLSKDLFV